MARPRRSQDTRERLLEAGVQALREHGYHGTGLKAVLDRVRVPKGSFYNYFTSKEHFGAEVIRRYGELQAARLDAAAAAAGDDPLAALRGHYRGVIGELRHEDARGGCLVCNLAAELGGAGGACAEALAETQAGVHARLAELVARAQERGQVRGDLDAGSLAAALQDAWNGALLRAKLRGAVAPLEAFVAVHLGALLSPPATNTAAGPGAGGARPIHS